jgi:hypothetical protein
MINTQSTVAGLAGALLLLLSACHTPAQDGVLLDVGPAGAVPGAIITIPLNPKPATNSKAPQILIGNQVALLQSINVTGATARVLVPNLLPGRTPVKMRLAGDVAPMALGDIIIAPMPSKQLVLALRGGKVTLLEANPRPGDVVTRGETAQPRIAYDVLNQQGVLVTNGWIVHPLTGRKEVFNEPQEKPSGKLSFRQIANLKADAVFFIKIPNLSGGGKVLLYEAPAMLDLTTDKGRAQRRLMGEVTFK